MILAGTAGTATGRTQQGMPEPASEPGPGPGPGHAASPGNETASQDPLSHHIEEHMAERRNADRQKMLVADTDRLLELAQQLKAEVDKSNKGMLSVDVMKRAEQIEKLARSVKDKMRGY